MLKEEKESKLAKAVEDFLRAIDKSPGTYHELLQTPVFTASTWLDDILDGYDRDPADILRGGSPASGNDGLVVVRDLFFHSTCPHHLLPYYGSAHVAYVPGERIVGLSKIGRLVDCFAHRLILQEELGRMVVESLVRDLGAKGAACLLEAEQLCMVIRGVRKPGSRSVTSSYAGTLATDHAAKMEFLASIRSEG
jgi:GTP cyclohydrolase IA